MCLDLAMKTPEARQWRRSGVFIVKFENILHFFYIFFTLLLTAFSLFPTLLQNISGSIFVGISSFPEKSIFISYIYHAAIIVFAHVLKRVLFIIFSLMPINAILYK